MSNTNAYNLLTNEAHRQGNLNQPAARSALQLAKALIASSGLTGIAESAEYLRREAAKRHAGGLIANATSLNYAASFLVKTQQ